MIINIMIRYSSAHKVAYPPWAEYDYDFWWQQLEQAADQPVIVASHVARIHWITESTYDLRPASIAQSIVQPAINCCVWQAM